MKKLFYIIPLSVLAGLFSNPTFADGGGHHHGHHGWGHHHGHHHFYPQPEVSYYYPAPQVEYIYPQPQVNYYVPAPPPPVAYYPAPPAPAYGRYDQRNPAGLAGGVVGSVFGYELGQGDPIATGLGAAAGSYLGNGIGRGY